MNNYLILNFQNAKLFRKFDKNKKNRRTNDFVFSRTSEYVSRDFYPSFVEPITVHQISNMLHVLFNERPVPSFRDVVYDRVESLFEKAQNSYLKIDTPKHNNNDFYYETMHVRKAVTNAWNPSPPINWETIKRYIDDEDKFITIVSFLNKTLNQDVTIISADNLKDLVQNLDTKTRLELYELITNLMNISGLIYFFGRFNNGKFDKPDNSKLTCKLNKTAKMVNRGLEHVAVLSGQIIVPVTDDDINVIKNNSKGFAKILDGGLVFIDSVKNENNIDINGFVKVSEISDEKTKPAKNLII